MRRRIVSTDSFVAMATRAFVAMQLLDPFEIDGGRNPDQQIDLAGDIHLVRLYAAMQGPS